jgi:hypothetical protein
MMLAALLAGVLAIALLDPATAQKIDRREVTLKGDHAKQQFAAGERVEISANVADDIFATGREIAITGARAQTLFAAAGSISMKESTVRDMFAAALGMEIHGVIEDDAMLAVCPICPHGSGRLLVGPQARIGDDARLVAGVIEIAGTIGGNLKATARRIVISGTVNGAADLRAKEIVIAAGARLGGELVARSPKKPEIASGASIVGPVREIETSVDIPDPANFRRLFAQFAAVVGSFLLVGILVFGVLAQVVAPVPLSRSAQRIRVDPWGSVGRGLAWILILPAVGFVLFVTIVGIPAGLILTATFLVLLALAFVASAYAIGLWLRERWAATAPEPGAWGRIGLTIAGALILLFVWMVPLIGWIFALLALLGGIGAVATGLWQQLRGVETGRPA